MYGVSYDGLTAALALLHPHPALKAISEQASPVDQWMNDDDHRYGALRESYAFEYAVLEQADKNKNTHFAFDTYDSYAWYLELGPLSNINAKYLHGTIPYWNDDRRASRLRRLLEAGSVGQPAPRVDGSESERRRLLGSGRSVGAWQIFRHAAEHDPDHTNFMVAGPWYHGAVADARGRQHRPDPVRRPRHGARVSREHRGAVLPLLPSRRRRETSVAGDHLPVGLEHVAHYADWPPPTSRSRPSSICTPTARSRSTRRRRPARGYRDTFPIPRTRSVPAASDLADVSRGRLADVGGCRPALRR